MNSTDLQLFREFLGLRQANLPPQTANSIPNNPVWSTVTGKAQQQKSGVFDRNWTKKQLDGKRQNKKRANFKSSWTVTGKAQQQKSGIFDRSWASKQLDGKRPKKKSNNFKSS